MHRYRTLNKSRSREVLRFFKHRSILKKKITVTQFEVLTCWTIRIFSNIFTPLNGCVSPICLQLLNILEISFYGRDKNLNISDVTRSVVL